MPEQSRTAASYDKVAQRYSVEIGSELTQRPLERGLLDAFVALVGSGGRVADLGCGPGHVTAYLAERGLDPLGVDLSTGMVAAARERVPEITFEVGSMLELPLEEASLAGALAWFSVIHLDVDERPRAYAEFARVVRTAGWLMIGFHVEGQSIVGFRAPGEVAHVTTWWDEDVDVDFHFLDPVVETASLVSTGWRLVARLDREPMIATEPQTRRCYLVAQRL